MKNIHVLPTDKPSRVRIGNNGNFVIGLAQNATVSKNDSYTNQNIYITSDEEIKEGDWYIFPLYKKGFTIKRYNSVEHFSKEPCISLANLKSKKIILTTDQDLIKDGVQAIDDEFLEWFVKNPSCEEVEIKSWIKTYEDGSSFDRIDYEIIIPKEEPFKHKVEVLSKEEILANRSNAYEFIDFDKQETIEEAFDRIFDSIDYILFDYTSFEQGAKWQQERSYSEEDLEVSFFEGIENKLTFKEWFETFKKK